jgi:hypothetical protein
MHSSAYPNTRPALVGAQTCCACVTMTPSGRSKTAPLPALRRSDYWVGFRIASQLISLGAALLGVALFAGCMTNPSLAVFNTGNQVQLRSYQTRAFDSTDREKTLRAVIATMQDLGFVIDKADATLGSVSATKLAGYELRMTATVRPRGATQLIVRASAQYKVNANANALAQPIEDPVPYRDFFTALAKSMFLDAQQVD